MTLPPAPSIDQRTAADVSRQLQQLLEIYAPAWSEVDSAGAPTGVSAALIGVAARFSEIIIQRLNQVPQKNFLAFLDLLGAALLPPQPARVPLTFLLAKGSLADAVVPRATQVAAPPAPGATEPVVYETENELVVTSVQLAAALVRDPEEDTYADYSDDLVVTGSSGTSVFHGNLPIDHILYLGQLQFLSSPGISNLSLTFVLQSPAGDALNLKWEIWDGAEWLDITPADPAKDGTKNLRQSGTIQFGRVPPPQATTVAGLSMGWIRGRLLTPVTRSATPRNGMARAGQLPQIQNVGVRVHLHNDGLPVDAAFANTGPIDLSKDFYPFGEKPRFNDTLWMALEEAFSNAGSTITLNIQVTTPPGSNVQDPPTARPSDDLKLRWEIWNGAWIELGTSTSKGPVAAVVNGNPFTDTTNAFVQNGAVVFTLPAHVVSFLVNGKQSFWIRVRILQGNYGVEGHFVAKNPIPAPPALPFDFVLPTFQPPSISSLKVSYDLDRPALAQAPSQPDAVLAYNDFTWADATSVNRTPNQSFVPFQPSQDVRPTLYFGFVLPAGRATFPNNAITMFFRGANLSYGEKTIPLAPDVSRGAGDPSAVVTHRFFITNPGLDTVSYTVNTLGTQWTPVVSTTKGNVSSILTLPTVLTIPAGQSLEVDAAVTVPAGTAFGSSDSGNFQLTSAAGQTLYSADFITFAHAEPTESQQLQLTWEYWNGRKWMNVAVRDETSTFTTTGVVEFLAPPDFAPHTELGTPAWWLRVRWDEGDYDTDPRIDRVLLNTTMAAQTITVANEVLGSSDASASQSYRTTRAPVMAGQSLEVREPEMPSGDDLNTILQEEGSDAISVVFDSAGTPSEIWVRWHEVQDFYASDARSRHYTLDHITGQVTFGDGRNGLIPPVGSANLLLAMYKTGGGVRGNREAGSIVQLKTTVPYVDKVTNYYAATGGADAETLDSLVSRAPAEIRHRHRAVTREDYEDLVHEASPDVARALCVTNRDLVADPLDQLPPVLGNVSLIIVPETTDPQPQPGVELVRRVQQFISACCPATATVRVTGPLYLRVDVDVEIGLASLDGAGTLARTVQDALAAFLHPLTGGPGGQGWEFGREPHRSDLYTLIAEIPQVDHIRALTVQDTEDLPGSRETGRFLVYSGIHNIRLVFDP